MWSSTSGVGPSVSSANSCVPFPCADPRDRRRALKARGVATKEAHGRARELLDRLQIPERMWSLSPVTFSGGEQQRVNIARSFTAPYPVLLLDEPTAALDAENRERVVQLIHEAKSRGAAIIGIFHDREVREAVADRYFAMAAYGAAA